MRFCSFCGKKLDEDARFCKNCGKPVKQANESAVKNKTADRLEDESLMQEPITERKPVYEGKLYKCPSCGETLKSFAANCPSCGHEIRDIGAVGSIKELAIKLEKIEAQKMPVFKEKRSVLKMIIGKDLGDEDEAEEARRHFQKQKNQEKANTITNYPIPNTKEDIMEFMLLASSNVNKKGEDDVVLTAWISKLDQVYEKAKLSMGRGSDFTYIQNLYKQTKKQFVVKKVRTFLRYASLVLLWFFSMGMLWNPVVTIAIAVGLVLLAAIVFIILKKREYRQR